MQRSFVSFSPFAQVTITSTGTVNEQLPKKIVGPLLAVCGLTAGQLSAVCQLSAACNSEKGR